jgi:pimeloyl-ACP methyl ester carboxylesterase
VADAPVAREGLPPALYVHGLGGSAQNWDRLAAELADTVAGEAVDLPGYGWSAPPDDGDLSVGALARTVVAYLEFSGRGPVHLFGNSLGGAVATRVAALRPDLVRTLTLVSPALPEVPPQGSAVPTALMAVPGVVRLFERMTRGLGPEQRTEQLLRLCYGDPDGVPDAQRDVATEEFRRRMALPYASDVLGRTARGIVRAYAEHGPETLWRQAERVAAPVLLVYGLRDKLVAYRMARRAGAAFRDSRLLVIPDSGHVAMMEHPELVARAVRELLGASRGVPGAE